MANTVQNGQTCLEKRGMEERHQEITRSDYNIENQYSATHSDALSNGDPQGKGAGHGGHTHFLPDCTKPTNQINYSNFATSPEDQIGGQYDIEGYQNRPGRKIQMARSIYNYQEQYGANLVNTEQNQQEGQYVVGQQIGQK
jgi:hypothetical protein